MPNYTHAIEPLPLPASDRDVKDLADLLLDAVGSGAAVSFVGTLGPQDAQAWWRKTIAGAAESGAIILIARDADGIVGSVQMHPAWAPNQPHRGDICKLLVHRRARRTGLGTQLMHAIEAAAAKAGRRLLTLDAKRGGPAEQLYRRLGWTFVGVIPRFAVDTDGKTLHDTVIFYKELTSA
jgi:GNAT superfamily N-acetyltransferase